MILFRAEIKGNPPVTGECAAFQVTTAQSVAPGFEGKWITTLVRTMQASDGSLFTLKDVHGTFWFEGGGASAKITLPETIFG